jgi:hypothetical protein
MEKLLPPGLLAIKAASNRENIPHSAGRRDDIYSI